MANTNEALERNKEATMILKAYLSKVEPKLVSASLKEVRYRNKKGYIIPKT